MVFIIYSTDVYNWKLIVADIYMATKQFYKSFYKRTRILIA